MDNLSTAENEARMQRGELYYAFTPSLIAMRKKQQHACRKYIEAYNSESASRRLLVELWKNVTNDDTPLPARGASVEEDDVILKDEPWVDAPIKIDYGFNVILGKGVYINSNCTFIDTLPITIGSRTLVGVPPSSPAHPLDPFLRNGLAGPESGAAISIGEDCWLGGNVIVLPGVVLGGVCGDADARKKSNEWKLTDYLVRIDVVAGNPARIIRKIEVKEVDPNLAKAGGGS
ncbi:putative acetyltransferase [Lachnellula occidentalis]|uniref:Putative acetyltransferase n=1 Tax=Lachnellula occidentalis TaxID=215460 RepID=A0A8H8RQL4_9HELO|nr:putative acetyltransferase [Lachnellula occidentalis]